MAEFPLSGVLLVALAGLGALGWVRPRESDPGDTPFWFLCGVPLFLAPLALMLADARVFSTPVVWGCVLVWAATGCARLRQHAPPRLPRGICWRWRGSFCSPW